MNSENNHIPLDIFIDDALYNKNKGYYMTKKPFGKHGDFITAPNISILFSEMVAIWLVSIWEKLGSPKELSIVELGAGNGEMMFNILNVLKKFSSMNYASNFYILEISFKLLDKSIFWRCLITDTFGSEGATGEIFINGGVHPGAYLDSWIRGFSA